MPDFAFSFQDLAINFDDQRLESDLRVLVGSSPVRVETPGWIAHSLDQTT
jgi:hypothetical protein